MLIGGFSIKPGDEEITGWIRSRTLDMPFVILRPIPEERRAAMERSERANTGKRVAFEMWEPNCAGNLAPVGTVWERQKQDGSGTTLFCLIDDPSFANPTWGSFFRNDDGSFDVVWRRDNRQQSFGGNQQGYANGGQRQGYGGYGQRQNGGYQRQSNGGFSGGSTAGANGEYVGGGNRDLDDEVPF